jgi:hypothetical protein
MISADTIGGENSGERRNVTVARTLQEVRTNTHRSRNSALSVPDCLGLPGAQERRGCRPTDLSKLALFRLRSFECFSSKLPQKRHPERSGSKIYRVIQRLWRGVEEPVPSAAEGTPAVLVSPMLLGAFAATEAREQDLLRYVLDGHGGRRTSGTYRTLLQPDIAIPVAAHPCSMKSSAFTLDRGQTLP